LGDQRIDFVVYVKQMSFSHPLPVGSSYRLGRGAGAQVRIDDPSVSREHLLIHTGPQGVEIEELGSSNGTRLFPAGSQKPANDTTLRPNQRYKVREGDVIRIGSVAALLKFHETRSTPQHSTIPPSSFSPHARTDPEMRRVYDLALRAASTDISVLIIGETGAGKELLASAVHDNSGRSHESFLQLNCAALSESLLESELFGHEKGAFTGAMTHRMGLLESTKGGSVFLDEIGEMPLSTQAKLLRVLEERRIRRLGSNKSLPIDVRFVAATNRDMEEEVKAGRFRGDLYYRISGIVLHLPALRERPSEIEPLARHFLREHCLKSSVAVPELTAAGVSALLSYGWPGNVRELKNAMERAPILSAGEPIGPEHLPGMDLLDVDDFGEEECTDVIQVPDALISREGRSSTDPIPSRSSAELLSAPAIPEGLELLPPEAPESPSEQPQLPGAEDVFTAQLGARKLVHRNSHSYTDAGEREQVVAALEQCSGNQTRAAKLLGVSRRTLINRLDRLGIARPRKGS